jgi:shikimate dehydrogenase
MHQLAVFGNPITHTRSPEIHQLFAKQHGLEIDYEPILVPPGEFARYAHRFLEGGAKGFNITVPYKADAYHFVEQCSKAAVLAEAVNTISIKQGVIYGDNTDGAGLMKDIVDNLGWKLQDKKVLVLGAGGAVSGVVSNLLGGAPRTVEILNRTVSKAVAIVEKQNDSRVRAIETPGDAYDVIINGTSAALQGTKLDLPTSIITAESCCYDMSYGNSVFLGWCADLGVSRLADGLGMLVEQAALGFNIWFDLQVETIDVIAALRQ